MIVERRRRTRRRVYPLINTLFCHELFTHVFVMLEFMDLIKASHVCTLWRNHIKEMQETLFRHFYIHLGGNPATRRVECWKEEVRLLVQCESDLTVYHYAKKNGDECLKESVINDGGFYMDLCNHIVQKGGAIPPYSLVLYFKKRLSTQSAKWEFHDIINALCFMQEGEGIVEPKVCLRSCVDNGNLLRRIRGLFLENKLPMESSHINNFIKDFIIAKKLPDDNQTKLEIWNIVRIMAAMDQELWILKKMDSTKRLGLGKGKNFLF